MLKVFTSTIAVAALTLGLSASVRASTTDHNTRFTFSKPIALPGVTLPAGTYVFRVADPSTDRKVVQVLDESSGRSYALLNSIPSYRSDAMDEPSVSLVDTVAGMPAAVKTWWPEGATVGFEFIYPEDQYAKLTGNTISPTVTGDGLASIDASNTSSAPSLEAAQVAQAAPNQTQTTQPGPGVISQDSTREALPKTASPLPLIAILGALTLLGGALALSKSKA